MIDGGTAFKESREAIRVTHGELINLSHDEYEVLQGLTHWDWSPFEISMWREEQTKDTTIEILFPVPVITLVEGPYVDNSRRSGTVQLFQKRS